MTKIKIDNGMKSLIADKVRSFEPMNFISGPTLDEMSSRTIIEDIEIFDDEIMLSGNNFQGAINIYLTLNYGKGEDATWTSASFPGSFTGSLRDEEPVIEKVTVDTSSFYA